MKKEVHIAVLLMVKNETKCLKTTLDTVAGFADSIVVFDTGSTDNTIQILQDFSKESKIPLRLKEGEFVDFSTSRNVSLDFADTYDDIDYLVLLDCNDQLRGGKELRAFCVEYYDSISTGFLLSQEWWSGQYDRYYNIRLVKAHKGWRYRGSVHEWMKNTGVEEGSEPPVQKAPENIILYQDRTNDDDKSGKRFSRDKVLLLEDHRKDPTDARSVFYLAQTCSCLNQDDDSFYYYKLRSTMEGFHEEKFHSYLRAAETSEKLNHDWHDSMALYLKAFEFLPRVEPLLKICEHYKDRNWLLAYTFAEMACRLEYPHDATLFVNKIAYDYNRWHLKGLTGFYANFLQEGKEACMKAIEQGYNVSLDRSNLDCFYKKEKENQQDLKKAGRKEFVITQMKEIALQNPRLSTKQMSTKANKMWKASK
jgi:glycosyltransferase involved in cell wall biosynthesis